MPWFFNLLYVALLPLLIPIWGWRLVRGRFDGGGFLARLGGVAPDPRSNRPVIWLHGASIGEIRLLQPLISQLAHRTDRPQIVVSSYTPDGLQMAQQLYADALVFYLPYDFSWSVRRAFRTLNPQLLLLAEMELWPNLLLEARRTGVPVAVASSQINDQDQAHLQRIRRIMAPVLPAIRWWGVQTEQDAARVRLLPGTETTEVDVTGSLKYDIPPARTSDAEIRKLRRRLGFSEDNLVLVAGSTHAPEEQVLLKAWQSLAGQHPQARLVLIPRHSSRASRIAALARHHGLSATQTSNDLSPTTPGCQVTVIGEVGTLVLAWPAADVAFVGGTIAPDRGGQNMIEPAQLGKALCFGPNVWNFQHTADGLLKTGGARQVCSEEDIVCTVGAWFTDRSAAAEAGQQARAWVEAQRGATDRTVVRLNELLNP